MRNPENQCHEPGYSYAAKIYLLIVVVILLVAIGVRLHAALSARPFEGDGAHFASIAKEIREGRWENIDKHYFSFFCYPVVLADTLLHDLERALLAVSLVSGVLLVLVTYGVGNVCFNRKVAVIGALLVAIHPRLVQYSVKGLTESLLALLVCTGVWLSWLGLSKDRLALKIFGGIMFGAASLVRNETLFFLLLYLLVMAWFFVFKTIPRKRAVRDLVIVAAVCVVVVAIPILLVSHAVGGSVFLSKGSANLLVGKVYSKGDMLAWQEAVYSLNDERTHVKFFEQEEKISLEQEISLRDRASTYASNLLEMVKFYPVRLLVCPLIMVLAVIGLLAKPYTRDTFASALYVFLFWLAPHLVYPLVSVSPQYFIQTLPFMMLWAGRGCPVVSDTIRSTVDAITVGNRQILKTICVGLVYVALVGVLLVGTFSKLGREPELLRPEQIRNSAKWLKENINQDTPYITSNASLPLLSDRSKKLALPWANLEDLLYYARYNHVKYIVFTSADLAWRPTLSTLANPSESKNDLIWVKTFESPDHISYVHIYSVQPEQVEGN